MFLARSNHFEQRLEALIHVHLLVTMEERQALLLWRNIDVDRLKCLQERNVFSQSGCWHFIHTCEFKRVTMQVQRMILA